MPSLSATARILPVVLAGLLAVVVAYAETLPLGLSAFAIGVRSLFESRSNALSAASEAGDAAAFNAIADSTLTGTVQVTLDHEPDGLCAAAGTYTYDVSGTLLADGNGGLVGTAIASNSTVLGSDSSAVGILVYDILIGGSASADVSTGSGITIIFGLSNSLSTAQLDINGGFGDLLPVDGCVVTLGAASLTRVPSQLTGNDNDVDMGDSSSPAVLPGTDVVTTQNLLTNSRAAFSAVTSRISAVFSGRGGAQRQGNALRYDGGSGLAGGDLFAGLPVGVWASYTRSDFDDDFATTAFDGDRNLVIGGVDVSPLEDLLIGLSGGYEMTDVDTLFNRGNVTSDGVLISPYFAYRWSEHYQIDAIFGYTRVDTEQFRTLGLTRISSDTHSDRYFWGGNFTGSQAIGNWNLAARFGLLWLREYVGGFTESNGTRVASRSVELSQWRLGVDAAYTWGNFEPYANATYERDFAREPISRFMRLPGDDHDGVVAGAGIRYYHDSGFTGSFEWNGVLGRSAYNENSYNIFLRKQF